MAASFFHCSSTMFAACFLIPFSLLPFANAVSFQIPRFSPELTNILYRGDAEASFGAIHLNKVNDVCRVGQAIYSDPIPVWDSNTGKVADFATHFSFAIDTQGALNYGDGLIFFLAPADFQIPPNSFGAFLGLFNTSNRDSSQNQIVSVEFDSVPNLEWDPGFQHVGINVNSVASKTTAPWNASLHSSETAECWIIYNSSTKNLSVYWSYGSNPNSSLSYGVDLKEILPQWVIVGFSGVTGIFVEKNQLYSWEFTSDLDIKRTNPGSKKWSTGLTVGLSTAGGAVIVIVAGLIIIAAIIVWRKHRKRSNKNWEMAANLTSSINEDLERGAGPRRFSYKDLVSATNNFSKERKLGEGGCGEVYRGDLVDMNIPVAVKKFSRRSKQGKKQYITEVKTISSLRHRNLVQLIGWCHDNGEFLLVYEFMPNGSLDSHLFGKKKNPLPLGWALRYKIAMGLASALLYLHEEWEQCVVHRDIKSSNIILDSSFNVKLGDFGLARFMDHELGPQTTGLAGTLGYLAPEYVSTGRASKESDVYSFGIVALEIASGRKSVDPMPEDKDSEPGLAEYVWDLFGSGKIGSVVDERLKGEFDVKEVECLLIVGLWCAHPNPTMRPSIRQAIQVLNMETALPKLPAKMPVPMYATPAFSSSSEPLVTFSSSADIGR